MGKPIFDSFSFPRLGALAAMSRPSTRGSDPRPPTRGSDDPGVTLTKEAREEKRAKRRAERMKGAEDMDLADIAANEAQAAGSDEVDKDLANEYAAWQVQNAPVIENQPNILLRGYDWLFSKPMQPPPEWATYRRDEIMRYIKEVRMGPLGWMPESFDTVLFKIKANRKVRFWGERDNKGRRDGRGICLWPDPPWGGGESYFGLWREDQPNGHGCFRWFDGDIYLGEWNVGLLQGFGSYSYGDGPYSKDKYEGAYFAGMRQGTGVYKYAPKNGVTGAVYMGEWLRGMMHGHGMLTYADGESYRGEWKMDRKQGNGEYKWGWSAGEVAGDKYHGQFYAGFTHGLGTTMFADGGYHKGRYAKGKMNGYGILRVADGWEYIGTWQDDELHGEVVCFYAYCSGVGKEVQTYNMGEYVSTRPYDSSKDWGELESIGLAEARNADKISLDVANTLKQVARYARRAQESQLMAKDAAEEARYMTRAVLTYKEYLKSWYGLKPFFSPED